MLTLRIVDELLGTRRKSVLSSFPFTFILLTYCLIVVFAVMIPVALRYAWTKEITQAADSPEAYDESFASSSASLLVLDENELVSSSRRKVTDSTKKAKKHPFHYHDETPDEDAPFRIDDEEDDDDDGGEVRRGGRKGREGRTLDKASKILGVSLSHEEYSRR